MQDETPKFLLSEMHSTDTNDKEQQDFFAALGRALSCWQFVESSLHALFEAAIQPALPDALSASFHQIQTFNGKLQVTDVAVRVALLQRTREGTLKDDGGTLHEWEKLFDNLKKKNDRRNELAHFSGSLVYENTRKSGRRKNIRLKPQIRDTRYSYDLRKPADYGISEVLEWDSKFFELGKKTMELSLKVRRITEALPKASS
jgi:hypothetical protein